MAPRADVLRLAMRAPDDVSALRERIADGRLAPERIIAILAKTEGNGCVNDFTRGYATRCLRDVLAAHLSSDHIARIPLVMSGGTEGGIAPHCIVLTRGEGPQDEEPALAMAGALTRPLQPNEIGRAAQARLVRDAVLEAMTDAGISDPRDAHFIQVKCPLLTAERAAAAGHDVATADMLKSMGLSRGASALGVALALGEVDTVTDAQIGTDTALWSSRASCSAGIELMACEVVVLGQSALWSGPMRIAHGVMQDAIDVPAIAGLLERAAPGAPLQGVGDAAVAVLAKAEASRCGTIRGRRHTMLEDSDVSATRHARAFVGGLIAGLVGHGEIFVSGGAEHQGPDGGGPIAIIYDTRIGASP